MIDWKMIIEKLLRGQLYQIGFSFVIALILKLVLNFSFIDSFIVFYLSYMFFCLFFTRNLQEHLNKDFQKYKDNIKMLKFAYEDKIYIYINTFLSFIIAFFMMMYVFYYLNVPFIKELFYAMMFIILIFTIAYFFKVKSIVEEYNFLKNQKDN